MGGKPSAKRLRCFISAPFGVDTSLLRRGLEQRGVTWLDATNIAASGSALHSVEDAMRRCDFVCVLFGTAGSDAVLVEIGLARGMRLPVLVFVEPGLEPPRVILNMRYAVAKESDKEAVNLHLNSLLRHLKRDGTPPRKTRLRIHDVQDLSWINDQIGGGNNEREMEELVLRAFRASGALAVEGRGDSGVDMALWIDELAASLGNPILVEVKRVPRLSDLGAAEDQLLASMRKTHAPAGILVYTVVDDPAANSALTIRHGGMPLLFAVGAQSLVELVASGTLFVELHRLRNQAVHGERE